MFPGMNPRKMQQMMKKMGIQQVDITEPSVAKVNMMGQETFQISGNIHENEASSEPEISEDDVKTVVGQSGASEEEAKNALEENNGDIAAAILALNK